jgi:hypothetical protein
MVALGEGPCQKKVADGHVALEVQEGPKNGVKGCRKGEKRVQNVLEMSVVR